MAKQKPKSKKKTAKAKSALALAAAMPGPTILGAPRMEVVDYIGWGNMIKEWSRKPATAPKTLQELKDQCQQAGVGLTVPNYITKLQVVVQADDTFVLRLPPATRIAETEVALQQGGLYPIPGFYNNRYGAILNIPQTQQKLDFHAQRIGDYIIRLTA
ncbi:MAG: hypothetical protein AB7F22_23445 [Reyranella sp.]|uniref:hypothetical protein n=1 Tax=Reyranella sp. TaxID=1929291 RepID=UPI003D0A67B5